MLNFYNKVLLSIRKFFSLSQNHSLMGFKWVFFFSDRKKIINSSNACIQKIINNSNACLNIPNKIIGKQDIQHKEVKWSNIEKRSRKID